MTKKVGRNEPCWCGSGKKFKNCHLRRVREQRPTIQEAIREKKRTERKYCLHPSASKENCEGGIIKAHTIQRSGGLSRIAQNGHVYMPTVKLGSHNLMVKKIGLRKATTFTGFCNKHDTETFRSVETVPFESNEEHCFFLGYRAICHELFKKRSLSGLIDSFLTTADRGLDVPEQMAYQEFISSYETGTKEAVRDLEFFKHKYDEVLVAQDYSGVRFYVVRFSKVTDILCSSALLPEIDFNGNVLQDIYEATIHKKRLEHFTFSLTTTDRGGAAVFSWLGDEESPKRFIESLINYNDEQITHALLRFAFEFVENTAISPIWWDKLSEGIQNRILERLRRGIDFVEERRHDWLTDDGIRAVEWVVDCRETNMQL